MAVEGLDIFERLRALSWWRIVKSLPFEGGASSTKWVYLACAAVVNACLIAMVGALCYVYIHSHNHEVNIALTTLIGTTIGVVVAIPANSTNHRRATYATMKGDRSAGADSQSTPLSSDVTVKGER
jgi:hypothetical protein